MMFEVRLVNSEVLRKRDGCRAINIEDRVGGIEQRAGRVVPCYATIIPPGTVTIGRPDWQDSTVGSLDPK